LTKLFTFFKGLFGSIEGRGGDERGSILIKCVFGSKEKNGEEGRYFN
jgi:hypothetical protein